MKAVYLLKKSAGYFPADRKIKKLRLNNMFLHGAEWMHGRMKQAGGDPPCWDPGIRFQLWGYVKYTVCAFAVVISGLIFLYKAPYLLPLCFFIFYLAEVHFLFLFPLMIDKAPRPLYTGLVILYRIGLFRCVSTVIPIGLYMMVGLLKLRNPLENWYRGCMAVIIWYQEEARKYCCHEQVKVRKETYPYHGEQTIKVMYLSDLHLKKSSRKTVTAIIQHIQKENPGIILLGGDYIDTPAGWIHFHELLDKITPHPHIYAIYGNHDRLWKKKRWEYIFHKSGVQCIHQSSVNIRFGTEQVYIEGRVPQPSSGEHDLHIVCLHQPRKIHNRQPVCIYVLAGHLHGGQVVLWKNEKGLYPGRWFYRFNFLKHTTGNIHYLVSRGLGDTLPVRWKCPKEIIMIEYVPVKETIKQYSSYNAKNLC